MVVAHFIARYYLQRVHAGQEAAQIEVSAVRNANKPFVHINRHAMLEFVRPRAPPGRLRGRRIPAPCVRPEATGGVFFVPTRRGEAQREVLVAAEHETVLTILMLPRRHFRTTKCERVSNMRNRLACACRGGAWSRARKTPRPTLHLPGQERPQAR